MGGPHLNKKNKKKVRGSFFGWTVRRRTADRWKFLLCLRTPRTTELLLGPFLVANYTPFNCLKHLTTKPVALCQFFMADSKKKEKEKKEKKSKWRKRAFKRIWTFCFRSFATVIYSRVWFLRRFRKLGCFAYLKKCQIATMASLQF